jgi:flagellar motility protein MotE (MotC chaperone)
MRYLFLITFWITTLSFGAQNTKSYECTKIFESRKNELLVELGRIDEERQSLDALKRATEDLLKKKESVVQGKDSRVDQKLQEISAKEASTKKILEQNKKILDEIKQLKSDKVSQAFAKMKPSASAGILSQMPLEEASAIMGSLNSKVVGQILAKMDPKKGSEITAALRRIPSESKK